MEEYENMEKKFREAFAGYEPAPPEQGWSRLRSNLQPEPRYDGFLSWITDLPQSSPRFFRLSIGFTAAAVMLFLVIIWFSSGNHSTIRGHAYAGELRLCKGTAYLFRVEDKALPFDSLKNIRSSEIDEKGYYQFSQIKSGKYLVRISPQEFSEGYKHFLSSWYDQHISPDSAHLIMIGAEDLTVDVHLLPKE